MLTGRAYGTPFYNSRRGSGMGDVVCDNEGCYDGGVYVGQVGADGSVPDGVNPGGGFNVGGFLNTLTKDFTSIYKAVQPTGTGCTQYTGPGGQSYTSCSGTQQAGGLPGGFNFGGGSSSTWLLLALGVGAFLLFKGK